MRHGLATRSVRTAGDLGVTKPTVRGNAEQISCLAVESSNL